LHGVPILLKDNIVTLDQMERTSESVLLIGAKSAEESQVAVNLRKAGAILLGKASMTEWAHARWKIALAG
jgi:amidase